MESVSEQSEKSSESTDQDLPRRLLDWYDRNRRSLPWRESADPYRVWVSEVMLQQTRVETVAPRYERFLERFPTVQALADASVDEVVGEWSGLGYYRRARALHAGAVHVCESVAGEIPDELAELRKVPGIGRYTAGAIASIAFGRAEPAVDANAIRILSRRIALAGDPARAESARLLEAEARRLLDPRRPGDSNQALMDLGTMLCTPRDPACPECPLSIGCAARSLGAPEQFPRRRRRPERIRVRLACAVVPISGGWVFTRRPADAARLAGMWELPGLEVAVETTVEAVRDGLAGLVRERTGLAVRIESDPVTVRHAILESDILLEGYPCVVRNPEAFRAGESVGTFAGAGLASLGASSMYRKVLKALE